MYLRMHIQHTPDTLGFHLPGSMKQKFEEISNYTANALFFMHVLSYVYFTLA